MKYFPSLTIHHVVRAAEYADFLAKTDTFEHSGDEENGENLYWSWSSDPRCGEQYVC